MQRLTIATILACVSIAQLNAEPPKLVFQEDFESGSARWQVLDPETWRVADRGDNKTFEITERSSAYKPPVRSPGHIALWVLLTTLLVVIAIYTIYLAIKIMVFLFKEEKCIILLETIWSEIGLVFT